MTNNKVFKELFSNTDSILICDINGKVMYYEDFNDNINKIRTENAIGRSIFELYPFLQRNDFTVFKCMNIKKPIFNEFQSFLVDGVQKEALNSAYPLINETGVVGAIIMTIELTNPSKKKYINGKKNRPQMAKYDFDDIMTQNSYFKNKLYILDRLAKGNSNILIYGETGTGKELIAHTIHANSSRKKEPFIIQNCAAIPSSLIESILFGTAKGSFTGAIDKMGIFEAAEGGTIFLDEINSLSLDLQSKLLRTLENKTIRRVGDTVEINLDVRVIASTNEDLLEKVEKGEFRRDLYYRLNIASFEIPTLRQRTDDIMFLAEYYMNHYNLLYNRNITGFSKEVAEFFVQYNWPGNVRELKNVIEYIVNIADSGLITINYLPDYLLKIYSAQSAQQNSKNINTEPYSISPPQKEENQTNTNLQLSYYKQHTSLQCDELNELVCDFIDINSSLSSQLNLLEKEIITRSYIKNRCNITKTAKKLEISRQTLYNKLNKYGLL